MTKKQTMPRDGNQRGKRTVEMATAERSEVLYLRSIPLAPISLVRITDPGLASPQVKPERRTAPQ